MGRRSSSPPPHLHRKKPLKQAWMLFLTKQEDLRGTGWLHALVHIFVALSDAQAELEDSISRYERPFMQTVCIVCVLHWYVNRKCYGG